MKEINKQHDQLSGHLGIIAVPLNNIKSIQGSNIEFYNAELNYKLNCSKESISYSCPSIYSKAGISLDHKISASIIGRSQINDLLLNEMLKFQFIILLLNSNGITERIGHQSHGLNFTFEYTSSSDPNNFLGYTLSFEGKTIADQN